MAVNAFDIADDRMWTFTVETDIATQIYQLITVPKTYIREKMGSKPKPEQVEFQGDGQDDTPLTLIIHYGLLGTNGLVVQGVQKTNVVTVRCPSIQVLDGIHNNANRMEDYIHEVK